MSDDEMRLGEERFRVLKRLAMWFPPPELITPAVLEEMHREAEHLDRATPLYRYMMYHTRKERDMR